MRSLFSNESYFKVKEKVEARNELEGYAYSLKNQIGDKEKLGGKLSDEDKKTIEDAVDETISWLESNAVSYFQLLGFNLFMLLGYKFYMDFGLILNLKI